VVFFISVSPTKTIYTFLFSPMLQMPARSYVPEDITLHNSVFTSKRVDSDHH
jgi:hypothetical protein